VQLTYDLHLTHYFAVDIRLDCIPANMVSYSTVWRQTTINI